MGVDCLYIGVGMSAPCPDKHPPPISNPNGYRYETLGFGIQPEV